MPSFTLTLTHHHGCWGWRFAQGNLVGSGQGRRERYSLSFLSQAEFSSLSFTIADVFHTPSSFLHLILTCFSFPSSLFFSPPAVSGLSHFAFAVPFLFILIIVTVIGALACLSSADAVLHFFSHPQPRLSNRSDCATACTSRRERGEERQKERDAKAGKRENRERRDGGREAETVVCLRKDSEGETPSFGIRKDK